MLTLSSPESSAAARRYRFAGVVLDAERRLLRVDGHNRSCPRKAFELLLLLCKAPETVLSRVELIEALWPGGQVISDEALTQAIFRARAALGPYAAMVATVRGIGLRLDAPVSVLEDRVPPPALDVAAEAAPAANGRHQASALLRPRAIAALFAVVLIGAASYTLLRSPPSALVDEGFGLTEQDIHGEQSSTAAMVAEALRSDAQGEQARGVALLEAVHRNDTRTPIPALFLALWSGGVGATGKAQGWLDEARSRLGDSRDMYMNLLLDYITAEVENDPEQIIHRAGALLDFRPDAWRMRHARAHLMEYIGMREAALQEISRIRVERLGSHRKLDLTIADRASMGDVAGAQAILDRLPAEQDPAAHAFLSGRVAWSRSDFDAAYTHFLAAAERGYERARMDLYRRSLIYAGAIDAMHGRDEQAVALLERVRAVAEGRMPAVEIDVALLLAQLHHAAGRYAIRDAELDRALATSPNVGTDGVEYHARLVALRLRPDTPPPNPEAPPPDVDALWRAAEAVMRGDPEAGRQALAQALNFGILDSRLADEARWLELRLGLPVSAERVIDPPYPPLSRVVLRRQIRIELTGSGRDPGPLRP